MNITEYAGEPRVLDIELAEHLGFADPRMIRRLIDRHRDPLSQFGSISVTATENTDPLGRGRPGKSYLLNRKQALYLCTKSETPRAAEVTIQMVEVFDAWMQKRQAPMPLHLAQDWTLRLEAMHEPHARLVITGDVVNLMQFAGRFIFGQTTRRT